jgi:hypothetical protein
MKSLSALHDNDFRVPGNQQDTRFCGGGLDGLSDPTEIGHRKPVVEDEGDGEIMRPPRTSRGR